MISSEQEKLNSKEKKEWLIVSSKIEFGKYLNLTLKKSLDMKTPKSTPFNTTQILNLASPTTNIKSVFPEDPNQE